MLDPSSRSATVFKAVKTGAMTTSQWLALATSGFSANAVSTASPSSLYIFQFPAITGFLIILSYFVLGACALLFFPRFRRWLDHSKHKASSSFIRQRGNAGQLFTSKKLQRGASASRDVRYAIRDTGLGDGRHRIAATD